MSADRTGSLPSEAALVQRVREGSTQAYATLFAWHRAELTRAAMALAGPNTAEDIVAEAFTRTLALLVSGRGPQVSFRAYLFTSMRAIHASTVRSQARVLPLGAPEDLPLVESMTQPDGLDERFDATAVRRAFETLPPRWRQVLWLTAVEGRGHTDVGDRLDLSPRAVRALAFRAREGLRTAFIGAHLQWPRERPGGNGCRVALAAVPAYLRGVLPEGRAAVLRHHLARCRHCAGAADEAEALNRLLRPRRLPGGDPRGDSGRGVSHGAQPSTSGE